ncbi:MAG TPA: ABC transporter substrate-binding protein [Chloroflexota bacterium]|nr:ABC transporter substrate-binding protein [Chloroflexota bacterium]
MARYTTCRRLAAALAAVMLGACAAPGSAPSGQPAGGAAPAPAAGTPAQAAAPELQALTQAARQEGQLTLVMSGLDQQDELQRLTDGYNRAYGLDAKVQFTPNPNMPEIANKLVQEYHAGRPASTDLFIGTESHVMQLMRADALLPVDWQSWAPNVQNPSLIAPRGVAVELVTRTPGMTYNTSRLRGADVPTSLQELLKPQYKGRVASTPYAGAFTNLAAPELWGEARTLEFVRQFSAQLGGIMGCGEGERVAYGEFDVFAIDCGTESLRLQAQGASVDHAILSDVAILVYWFVAVPANAPHPNSAKLFVNYLLGREAQDLIYQYEFFDHHLVPGSKTAPAVEQLQARGVQFTEIDVEWSQRHEEQVVRLRNEIQNILQQRR